MNGRWSWIGGSLMVMLVFGFLAVPEADARGGRGGGHGGGSHGGGGGGGHARAPRVSAANRAFKAPTFKAPKMPRAMAPARSSSTRGQSRTNNTMARANNTQIKTNNAQTRTNNASTRATNSQAGATLAATTGTAGATTNAAVNSRGTLANTNTPYNYTYGTGANARNYRAHGFGQGYRNRYNGQRSGYGRSQGNNRAVVSRLRSAHSTLARLNADYRGHRVGAMHQISMAIRQLSHRSMVSGNAGFANGMNNNLAMGRRQGGLNGNIGGRRNQNQRMPQAQSDARMSQALRMLQGVNMQLTSQGSNTSGHARARGHVQYAMRHLNTGLSVR